MESVLIPFDLRVNLLEMEFMKKQMKNFKLITLLAHKQVQAPLVHQ